jgi:hypothetical protein
MTADSLENVALGKLTYGITPADRVAFKKLGFGAWLDDQLDPNKADSAFILEALTKFPSLELTPADAHNTFPYSIKGHLVADEVIFATLLRRYWSDRQVYEMLVEFLSDYNPVPRRSDDYSLAHYDAQVIRANALGNYPDLVLASSRSPGMLDYLNGNQNEKNHPNENYGRELLELFTVTTAYPYTQDDVVNAARVLTGIIWPSVQPDVIVRVNQHWVGAVQVLGWSDPNPGGSRQAILATAESLVRYLANHSATAQAFSLRMARRFVSDTPPKSLLTAMAATYTKTSGNIPAVFKTMALSPEFAASYRAKTKRPSEFFGSVIRGLDLKLSKPVTAGDPTRANFFFANPLNESFSWAVQAGHLPMNWPFPNGYPDTAAPWTTMAAQVGRWNKASNLARGVSTSSLTLPNYKKLLGNLKTSEQIIDAAASYYLGAKLPTDERTAAIKLLNQIDGLSESAAIEARTQIAVGLVMSKPEWNLR